MSAVPLVSSVSSEPSVPFNGLQVQVDQTLPMPLQGGFSCGAGQLLALVGPSGAGKTSFLRMLAGLMRPQVGRVTVGDAVWCDTERGIFLTPSQRHVGMVFQQYALMPHLSALDNVALALLHLPRPKRLARAREWLERVRLSAEQQLRRPAALSGGQQQRVAVARALAREPRLLLLDEPFSAVDQMNRQNLYPLLADLRKDIHIPMVLVTHDLAEARMLADTLVVMDGGQVLQQGSPAHLYRAPRNVRVADLVGVQNRFRGTWLGPVDGEPGWGWLDWTVSADPAAQPSPAPVGGGADGITDTGVQPLRLKVRDKRRLDVGQQVAWVIQSDGLHLLHAPQDDLVRLCARLTQLRNLGDLSLATLELEQPAGVPLQLTLAGPQRQGLAVGQRVCVGLDREWVHVMPTRSA
jgi:molybdate transport system ATP-binding protein